MAGFLVSGDILTSTSESLKSLRSSWSAFFSCRPSREAEAPAAESSAPGLVARLASVSAVTGYERCWWTPFFASCPAPSVTGRETPGLSWGEAPETPGRLPAGRARICGGTYPGRRLSHPATPPRAGPPLFDQQLEGHRVTVQGRRGPVPGVVAVRSIHLTRGRKWTMMPLHGR